MQLHLSPLCVVDGCTLCERALSSAHTCSRTQCVFLYHSLLYFLYDCEGWIKRGQHDLSVGVKGQLLRIASHLTPC